MKVPRLDLVPQVQAMLARRARVRKWTAAAGIVFGLPLCLLGPAVLGSMYWMALLLFGWHQPMVWVYGIAVVVVVPLLFRLEIQTGGRYLGDTMRGSAPRVDNSVGLIAASSFALGGLAGAAVTGAVYPEAMPTGIIEVFLTGPRLVVGGWRHLRQSSKMSTVDIELAARIVATLLQRQDGLAAKELTAIGRPMEAMWPCLVWLAVYGWIGVTEDQQRVYLYTDSRRTLSGVRG